MCASQIFRSGIVIVIIIVIDMSRLFDHEKLEAE
jgi:hypothetical protein